jgi:hypothetical protein
MVPASNDSPDLFPPDKVRAMQIIAFGLICGLGSFLLIVIWLVNGPAHTHAHAVGQLPILSFVAMAVFATNFVLFSILPGLITRQGVQNVIAGKWQQQSRNFPRPPTTIAEYLQALQQTTMIVGLALLEGAGFMAGIAYMLEGRLFALSIAIVILLIMLIRFPTLQRARDWMARCAEQIEQFRS